MFFFKRKEIIVDCFTPHYDIYESYRPLPANNFIPEGWKSLPKTINMKALQRSNMEIPRGTMKMCKGFTNLFSSGFIIQLWSDVALDSNTDPMSQIAASNSIFFNSHPDYQMWDGLYRGYKHVKFSSPWALVEKTGVKFTWNRCDWHNTDIADKMHMVSAVTDFKYQHHANMNIFIKDNSIVKLTAGQPMVHLIPMSEHKLKLKYHLISLQEFDTRFYHSTKFSGEYKENVRLIDNKSKCPFGFGK